MKPGIITFFSIAPILAAGSDLVSPNGQYEIEYFEAPAHEANVKLKNARTGKVFGYASSQDYRRQHFLEVAWSPDSRYLAVAARGTKTTADITLFSFAGDTMEEVRLPDYRLNLLGRRHLVRGGRHHWVSELQWRETTITFRCHGQWKDGAGDPTIEPENWYHFQVSLRLGGPGSAPRPELITVVEAPPPERQGE